MSNGSDSYFFGEVQEPGVEEQLFLHSYAYADCWDVKQEVICCENSHKLVK